MMVIPGAFYLWQIIDLYALYTFLCVFFKKVRLPSILEPTTVKDFLCESSRNTLSTVIFPLLLTYIGIFYVCKYRNTHTHTHTHTHIHIHKKFTCQELTIVYLTRLLLGKFRLFPLFHYYKKGSDEYSCRSFSTLDQFFP